MVPAPRSSDIDRARLSVAYLVSRFPKVTETFIVNEAITLEDDQNFSIDVHSMLGSDDPRRPSDERLLAHARFGTRNPLHLLAANARWVARAPRAWFDVHRAVVAHHWRQPGLLVRYLYATWLACTWADDLAAYRHVHAHWATFPAHIGWVAARLTEHRDRPLRFSFTAHAHDIQVENPMLVRKLAAAAAVITISDHNRTHLVQLAGPELDHRLHVIRCGVDTASFAFRPEPAPRADGERAELVCVASFMDYKGHSVLLDAMALLRRDQVPVRLTLIGDGALRPQIEEQIARLGLGDDVELAGWRRPEEVRATLAGATMFVSSSIVTAAGQTEGIPVAQMEAMAIGLPVVATRVSGVPELVIDGETGLTVPHSDPGALAAAVVRVLDDPAAARQMAVAGRAHVEAHYDHGRNVARLADVLRGLAQPAVSSADTSAGTSAAGTSTRS
jgi:glycosyltransferase involved in cell wall biosynthesis